MGGRQCWATPSARFNDDTATLEPKRKVLERGAPQRGGDLPMVARLSLRTERLRWLALTWRCRTTQGAAPGGVRQEEIKEKQFGARGRDTHRRSGLAIVRCRIGPVLVAP
jgi:hypothetical protein